MKNKLTPSHKLRIMYVDHTAKLGGGEIALRNLLGALDLTYIEPVLLSFEEGPLVDQLRDTVEVHVVALKDSVASASRESLGFASILKVRELVAMARHTLRVSQLMRHLDVDLIHTNSLKSDIIGGLAGRLAGRPVIWHVRDRIAPDYLPATVVRIFRALSRVIPSFVITVSQAVLTTISPAEEKDLLQPSRAAVVYDGLSEAALAEGSAYLEARISADSIRRIGLIGRICNWKGQHIFIQAAAIVHKSFPDVQFEIIGAPLFGEEEYEASLRLLCSTLNLNHVVTFAGFVTDVPRRVAELEIVVHASTIGEPFGLVIIEAMAQGKPIVATRGGGVPEIVIDGVTGLLVSMNDAQAMAHAIVSLLQDSELGKQMGRQGRSRVERTFTLEQTARGIESIYRRLLKRDPLQTAVVIDDYGTNDRTGSDGLGSIL